MPGLDKKILDTIDPESVNDRVKIDATKGVSIEYFSKAVGVMGIPGESFHSVPLLNIEDA